MNDNEYGSIFQHINQALRTLEEPDMDAWARRCHFKARRIPELDTLRDFIDNVKPYPENEDSTSNLGPDRKDCHRELSRTANFWLLNGLLKYVDSGCWFYLMDVAGYFFYMQFFWIPGACRPLAATLWGEHIQDQLTYVNSSLDLRRLAEDEPDFQTYFKDQVITKEFASTVLDVDTNHVYSIATLLVADYLYYQDWRPTWDDNDNNNALVDEDRPSYQILSAWATYHWETEPDPDDAFINTLMAMGGQRATALLLPSLNPQLPSAAMQAFFEKVVQTTGNEKYKRDIGDGLDRWMDISGMADGWTSFAERLYSAFSEEMGPQYESAMQTAVKKGKYYKIHKWCEDAVNATTFNLPLLLPDTTVDIGPDQRSILVERLYAENPKCVAMAETFKGVQDKRGMQMPRMPILKINGDSRFSTPAQVFHTPTGLRAMDYKAARSCNPYAHIDPLKVGHFLYRREGEGYEAIEVRSIQVEPATPDRIYALSLPQKQGSFHVNGYLVTDNNPEREIRSITDELRALPAEKRLALLASLNELNPMFGKHDLQTTHERLNLELFGKQRRTPRAEKAVSRSAVFPAKVNSFDEILDRLRNAPRPMPSGVPLNLLEREFTLTATDVQQIPRSYQLPVVQVVDGHILVNEEPQLRSSFDNRQRCYRWSRAISPQVFEHGMLNVDLAGVSGHGVILLADSPEPNDDQAPQPRHVCQFRALMRGADVEKVPEPKGEATFTCTHYVTMTYDRSPWAVEDDNKTEPDDPIAGLDVRVGIHTSAGGADMPSSKIPKLDELQKLIKDQLGYDLGRLYDCHHEFLADGGIRVAVQFNLASLVPFISDIGPTITTVFGVGFQEALKSDITLSILCSSFYIDVNAEETSATGALYEYNPTVREMKGDRHFICGTVTSARKNFGPLRSKVSKVCCPSIDSVNPGWLPTVASTARQKPAKVTERLGQRVENNINQLLEPLGYSEAVIHNLSQANVTAAMYYHMSNKQLELTGQTRPTNLATSLADSLPDELSSFLREKYAPAFLCQVVKRDKTYGKKLTDQEKKNLWYWWNGNGKQCLARSKEHAEITRIASTEALIEYMGDDLQRFLDDDPQTWARRVYDEITQERRMYMYMKYPMQGAAGTKQSSGVNVMNRVCTMLDALDRSHNYADDWFQATMAFVGARQLQYPFLASDSQDSEQAAEWLADILHRLIVLVLDGDGDDGTLDPDVRAGLREDIVAFEEANGLDSSGKTAEDRATEIVRTLGEFTTSLGGWMSAIDKGLAAAFAGTSLYKWTEEAFANLSDAWGDKIPGLSKMKGAVSIAMKAAAILEVIGTTVEGISSAKESWDAYRTRAKAENFEDYVQTSELDRGTYTALSEDGEGIAEVCEAVNPDVSLHEVVGDHLTPEGQATAPDDAEHWNEPPDRPPAGVPPEGEDVASKWSIGGRALKLFNVCLGIVLVGAAIYSLVDWNKLSTGQKILDILSDLTQTLQVVLDIVELFTGPDFVMATGVFATALPVLGAVLAIIGLVLMLVNFFISLFSPPPEDPVDTFLKKQGKPLLDALEAPPDPQLQYTLSTDAVHAHEVDPLAVTGINMTDQPVTVPNVRVSLTGGTTADSLFDADHFDLVAADDPARDEPEHVYVAPAATAGAAITTTTLGNGAKNEYHEYEMEIAGCQPADDQAKTGSRGASSLPPLVLQPGESFTVQWTAAVNKKGDSLVDVIEKSMLDRCHVQMSVVRV